jgi:glycerophosphoryl diester phosphodiesterase
VLVCGRYWPAIDELGRLPHVRPVLSARNKVELARLRQRLVTRPAGTTPYGVSVHRSLLTHEVVSELHRSVEVVMTWPVNDAATLDLMLDAGVSGVISDSNDVLTELIRRRR